MSESDVLPDPVPLADRIEAIQSDGVLSAAAKAVMIRLLLRHPAVKVRDACPLPAMLAPWLCLTERSVRRAYAELERFGWLSGTRDRSLQRPVLIEDDPLTRFEHVAALEWLRDRAVAAGRIAAAVTAEKAAGRVMGFYDRPRTERADRNVRANVNPPPSLDGGGQGGGDARETFEVVDRPPPSLPHLRRGRDSVARTEMSGSIISTPEPTQNPRPEPAKAGVALAKAGSELAKAGSNWRELAEIGRVEKASMARWRDENINRLKGLMDDPELAAEIAAMPGPEPGSEWALWEAGLRRTGGQKCPAAPVPASPPPAPAADASILRDFVPWNERPVEKPYDPISW